MGRKAAENVAQSLTQVYDIRAYRWRREADSRGVRVLSPALSDFRDDNDAGIAARSWLSTCLNFRRDAQVSAN